VISGLTVVENARSRLEAELEQVRSATANEASQTTSLKSRISSLETANRDALGLLESKTTAYDKLAQDLSAQHQKAVELRKQISTLEQSTQSAHSAVASAKFREQSLQQEIDLLKKNNEWLENERRIKAEEHTNFRREKNARISELSRSNEQYISEAEALRRSESALKHRLEEQHTRYEEALQEIQKLRDEKISAEDAYRVELETVNRLAELQKASADTAKQRVQELADALEEAKDEAAEEIGRIRAEIQTEHEDRVAAERRVAELEASVEQLQSELEQARARPSTPQRPVNGTGVSTPVRPSTPMGIFSPSSTSRLKGSLSTTQLYTDYKKLERDLATEKRVNEQLQSQVDAMLEDLEASKPEIDELRMDHSRLQSELAEMSTLVDKATEDRDAALKEVRSCHGQLESKAKEIDVLSQQLRDAGSEIRYLLIEQHVREHGESMSRENFEELQKNAEEALRQDAANLSETQQVVNQQLIVFKTVAELQQQNENQLKTIRNLVSKLESNEAREREQQHEALAAELESARAQIASYQDEIKIMVAQSKSFAKERDMFRNMLTRRGHLPGLVDPKDFSKSLPLPAGGSPAHPPDDGSIAGGDRDADYAKLLKDQQQHFDSYRQEAAADHSALKMQVDGLTKKNSQLQAEVSRTVGQLTAANQRYEMLQASFDMVKGEYAEVQKRSYAVMENATRQELKTQQVAEELVEARGLLDSLRRESANLKAEKDLWKSVEKRLVEDNEALRNERSRLDQLNGSLQTMVNEREQADAETRRRLQAQVEASESELQSLKRRLHDEVEESKNAVLRREYEHEQSQKRIDDLVTSLSTTREELAAAKTARDHLQARVDELTVELRSAEERLDVLTKPPTEPAAEPNGTEDTQLSREQELAVELSELKRDLDLKTSELARTNEQIEVYKEISQSAEERLEQLGETNDQYRRETEAALAEKDEKITDLEQRIEEISAELSTTNTELSQLRDEQGEFNRKLDEQKTSLNTEIERLKEEVEKNAEQAQFNLEASKAQAQIATEAQQNYENELVKHAEAAQTLHSVRAEANQMRLEVVDLKTQAETARTTLEQREASWSEMKDRYERELADIKKRREEALQQNNLLHGQLENLTKQVTALQRDRADLAEGETTETGSATADLDNLQEVIKYLRREKEIVDVQYHLSTQDAKRLRQQLEFTQSQLDETRLKLDQQRRTEADFERNALSHNKLMETLNELNLYRESSVTLRAEVKQAHQALSEKGRRVGELEEQVVMLQAKVAELEDASERRDGDMKLLQEDRDHWQQRTLNIISKYDRVDPAELESLKEKITGLESERDAAVAAQAALQTQVDAIPEQIETAKTDLRTRLGEQFKERSKILSGRIKEKQNEVDAALAEKAALQTQLDSTREQLAAAQAQPADATFVPVNGEHEKAAADEAPSAQGADLGGHIADLEAKVAELEASLAEKERELETLKSEQDEKFKAKEMQLKEILNKRLSEVKQEAQNAKVAALDELRKQLHAEHEQLAALRAPPVPGPVELQQPGEGHPPPAQAPGSPTAVIPDSALDHLSEAKARYLVQKNETVRAILRTNIRKAVEKEKETLRKQLTQAQGEAGVAEHLQELERKFAAEKETLLQQKEAEFAAEKEALVKQHEESLAREKESLVTQHQEELASQKLQFDQESERKIAEQIRNAEQLGEKRGTAKLSMAQNQGRIANAKLEVVKKAAEETPEKAVAEVWEVAKIAKPPPPARPAPPAKPITGVGPSPLPPPSSPSAGKAAGAGALPAPPQPTPNTSSNVDAALEAPKQETTTQHMTPSGPAKTPQNSTGAGSAGLRQLQSGLPRGAPSIRGGRGGATAAQVAPKGQHAPATQGGTTGPQQSGAGRGTGIPRGRGMGRGGGRAGAQSVQAGIPHASGGRGGSGGASSPSRGGLNPHATQFIPGGNKRAREDGEAGDNINMGKRIRGGGAGSA